MRGVTTRSLLVLAGVTIAILVFVNLGSAGADPQARARATTDHVGAKEFSFKLSAKSTAKPGTVTFAVKNNGHVEHNFKIAGKRTPDIQPGRSAKLVVRFTKKGKYRYLCTIPGHAAAGMKGVFTVR
jgi:uncharacterized cupredoxin-like copper-binding protein